MRRQHFPALDGIRGLAIIGVLLRHASYVFPHDSTTRWFLPFFLSGMWGVDLFFVLSGFLITGILFSTKAALNRAQSFYGRRILRIFPIYYLILALVLVGSQAFPAVRAASNLQNLADRLSYLFYFQNLIPMWHHGNYPESIIGPFWSLAVEEQFYFVWPIIVWHLSPKGVLKLSGALACAALALRMILIPHFGDGIWLYAFTPTRADGLFVGSALAAVYAAKSQISKRVLAGMVAGATAALAVVAAHGLNQLWLTGPYMSTIGISAIAILCGALIVFCLQFGGFARLFQMEWLRRFGKYSYGIYVFHFAIYYAVQHLVLTRLSAALPLRTGWATLYVAVLIGVTYGVAWVSFKYFEQRFLALKSHFEPVLVAEQPPATLFGEAQHA